MVLKSFKLPFSFLQANYSTEVLVVLLGLGDSCLPHVPAKKESSYFSNLLNLGRNITKVLCSSKGTYLSVQLLNNVFLSLTEHQEGIGWFLRELRCALFFLYLLALN